MLASHYLLVGTGWRWPHESAMPICRLVLPATLPVVVSVGEMLSSIDTLFLGGPVSRLPNGRCPTEEVALAICSSQSLGLVVPLSPLLGIGAGMPQRKMRWRSAMTHASTPAVIERRRMAL